MIFGNGRRRFVFTMQRHHLPRQERDVVESIAEVPEGFHKVFPALASELEHAFQARFDDGYFTAR